MSPRDELAGTGAERTLVLAPFGRDAVTLARVLEGRGYAVAPVGASVPALDAALALGADVFVLTAEACRTPVVERLAAHLAEEPAWSAPPVVLLAEAPGQARTTVECLRRTRPGLPIAVLLRPLEVVEIVSAIGTAIEARRAQHRVGTLLEERARAEERAVYLFRELAHRVKNAFSLVVVLARQTLREAPEPASFGAAFGERIAALSATYDALAATDWEGASLGRLIEWSVTSLLAEGAEGKRVRVEGPEVVLAEAVATPLALALHELATNARKYGALSGAEGWVDLCWDLGPDGRVSLTWRESAGPPVTPPARQGFGTRVIAGAFAGREDASVVLDYPLEGVVCRFEFPTLDVRQTAGA